MQRILEGGYRSETEQQVPGLLAEAFRKADGTTEEKLENFSKYVRRQTITRLLAQHDLVRRIVAVEGSVVECGVHRGASLFGWLHLTSILDPINWRRKIYGFDTFAGFPTISDKDVGCEQSDVEPGRYSCDSEKEIQDLCMIHDSNRILGHIEKVELIRGDATATIPDFLKRNPHVIVALLFLDFDLYEPTKVAIQHLVPRMPKGALIVFDELNHPLWPGETLALIETLGIGQLRIRRFSYYPNMSYAVVE
jgi:hypothetical protein